MSSGAQALSSESSTLIILLSGLAADASIFQPQKLAFENLLVPEWPIPHDNDTLDSYAAILADSLVDRIRSYETVIVGGASFGGIVALHLAARLNAAAVILIGSIRGPDEFPRYARLARVLKPLVRFVPVKLMQLCCLPFANKPAKRFFPLIGSLAQQFQNSDPQVFRWSLARILDWRDMPTVPCPIYQIHGDRDKILPSQNTQPIVLVRGGGHVISLTHAEEVNNFIRQVYSNTSESKLT